MIEPGPYELGSRFALALHFSVKHQRQRWHANFFLNRLKSQIFLFFCFKMTSLLSHCLSFFVFFLYFLSSLSSLFEGPTATSRASVVIGPLKRLSLKTKTPRLTSTKAKSPLDIFYQILFEAEENGRRPVHHDGQGLEPELGGHVLTSRESRSLGEGPQGLWGKWHIGYLRLHLWFIFLRCL